MQMAHIELLLCLEEHNFNLTLTAQALHKTQSALSKQLQKIEATIGMPILERSHGRLQGFNALGLQLRQDLAALKLHSSNITLKTQHAGQLSNELKLGVTHTQARYILPAIIIQLKTEYPSLAFSIRQGTPEQIANWAAVGIVDLAIATETLSDHPQLNSSACYSWNRSLICNIDHPLASIKQPTLKDLSKYPLVTYSQGYTGRALLDATFAKAQLTPNIVLAASDADIIVTYVKLGIGYGIVADMACMQGVQGLHSCSLRHVFSDNTTYIAYARGKWLTPAMHRCISTLKAIKVVAAY